MAKPWNEIGRYGGVGIDLVLAVLLSAGAGHWLDQRYGHGRHDYGMIAGFFFGIAVGVRSLVVAGRRMQKDIERAEANDPHGSRWTVDSSWVHTDAPEDGSTRSEDHSDEPPS